MAFDATKSAVKRPGLQIARPDRKTTCHSSRWGWAVVCAVWLLTSPSLSLGASHASYVYRLSDFSGPVPSLWARLTVDSQHGEVMTLNRRNSAIQIYNDVAMQIFSFGETLNLASANDIAADASGGLFILYRFPAGKVLHLDYRGEPVNHFAIDATLTGYGNFQPDLIDFRHDRLFLADSGGMKMVVVDLDGQVLDRFDFRDMITTQIRADQASAELRPSQQKKIEEDLHALQGASLTGFSVGADDSVYFTVATIFSAYRLSVSGRLEGFGIPGGAPGKFGVVAGIVANRSGDIFVADRLRCVVLRFDRNFDFINEFGYRGDDPQNLIVPDDIALDERQGRVYVSQAANQGVSVFNVELN